MSLLGKLFGKETSKPRQPYVHAGAALTIKLCRSLGLPDWKDGFPTFTQEEVAAVCRKLPPFQMIIANQEMGGEAAFHPAVLPPVVRACVGQALDDLARRRFLSDDIQSNWRQVASTYLKAWASELNPFTLLQLAMLLAEVGYKTEARETAQVILLVSTYTEGLLVKNDPKLIRMALEDANEFLRRLD